MLLKNFELKSKTQKKKKASHEINPTTRITLAHNKKLTGIILGSSTNIWIYQLTS